MPISLHLFCENTMLKNNVVVIQTKQSVNVTQGHEKYQQNISQGKQLHDI